MGGTQSDQSGGFRLFRISPNSPAESAGLEVFFDFIMDLNGEKLEPHQKSFFEKIQARENMECSITVYNVRTHTARQLKITPRRWGGVGLLGATVRYDNIDIQDNGGVRVLEVFPNSPAQQAGIVPYKDYLLGTYDVIFRDVDELVDYVSINMNKPVQMSVYNSDLEYTREVTITPNTEWGGEGCIGCDIGMGLLHRIPMAQKASSASSASSSRRGSGQNAPVDANSPVATAAAPVPPAAPVSAHSSLPSVPEAAPLPTDTPPENDSVAVDRHSGADPQPTDAVPHDVSANVSSVVETTSSAPENAQHPSPEIASGVAPPVDRSSVDQRGSTIEAKVADVDDRPGVVREIAGIDELQ